MIAPTQVVSLNARQWDTLHHIKTLRQWGGCGIVQHYDAASGGTVTFVVTGNRKYRLLRKGGHKQVPR